MALSITIAGTTKTNDVSYEGFSVEDPINERMSATFEVKSLDASYRPAIGAAVVIADGATTIFGGTIISVNEVDLGDQKGIRSVVTAVGYDEIPDRRLVTETLTSQTVKQVLQTLITNYLGAYSITLSPSQSNGPTMASITWDRKACGACLGDLTSATNYVRRIDASKVLRMWAASEIAAPWSISDATPNCIGLDVRRDRTDYFNRLYLRYTIPAVKAWGYYTHSGNFANGNTITIGSKTYTMQTTLTDVDGNVKIGTDLSDSINHIVAAIGLGAGAGTDYAAAMTQNQSVSAHWGAADRLDVVALEPGASGNSISVSASTGSWFFEGSIPLTALAGGADSSLSGCVVVNDTTEQGTYGLYERVMDAPDAMDYDSAYAIAVALLARNDPGREVVSIETRKSGLAAGQYLSVNYTKRGVNDTFLITSVRASLDADKTFRYTVEAEGDQIYRGTYLDTYRSWGGTGSATIAISGVGGGGASGSAALFRLLGGARGAAVQNTDGATYVAVAEDLPVVLDGDDWTGTIRVRCWVKARNAGVNVRARLYNVTDASVAGTGVVKTSTSWTEDTFNVTLPSGEHTYQLQIQVGTAYEDGYGLGQIEAV